LGGLGAGAGCCGRIDGLSGFDENCYVLSKAADLPELRTLVPNYEVLNLELFLMCAGLGFVTMFCGTFLVVPAVAGLF
jgi:hypothetical protein